MTVISGERKTWRPLVLIASLGFFALVAQTLLFREFLTVYEGSEFGLASFFASWLLCLALGALLGRLPRRYAAAGAPGFEWLGFLYLPAYVLQLWLISNSRLLAGVHAYELFPFWKMLPVSLLANAPVSLTTGFLFVLACGWISGQGRFPATRVYTWETAGSVLGGIAATIALTVGLSGETCILLAMMVVTSAMALQAQTRKRIVVPVAMTLLLLSVLLSGGAARWEQRNLVRAWSRILPSDAFEGSFTTPQARYLYGEHRKQFNVIAWESVTESFPETEHASEMAAVCLAQAPAARDILVIGPGSLPLCRRLLEMPDLRITYLHPDPEYPSRLMSLLPSAQAAGLARLILPGADIRRFLDRDFQPFDLVILNIPDAAALALNRYSTLEFYRQIKSRLTPNGVVCARFSGGENYMGDETAGLGASLVYTLGQVFSHLALKPGDESWLAASDSDFLSEDSSVLRQRLAAIPGAEAIYPPEGLMSLYPADRIRFQWQAYRSAIEAQPTGYFLNTDRHPKASLYSLLLAGKASDGAAWSSRLLNRLAHTSVWALWLAILVMALLRMLYRRRRASATSEKASVYDVALLLTSVGWVGLSLSLAMMFLYESREGSLFLFVGLLSALFMLGLVAGSLMANRRLERPDANPRSLAAVLLGGLALFIAGAAAGLSHLPASFLILLFLPAGLFCGALIPPMVALLQARGFSSPTAGGVVELFDNLGGVLGGFFTGLVLLPVYGVEATLLVLLALVLVNLPILGRRTTAEARGDPWDRFARAAGHVMAGLMLVFVLFTRFHHPAADSELILFEKAARKMAADKTLLLKKGLSIHGRDTGYFRVDEGGENPSWIYRSDDYAGRIAGYGGPMSAAVWVAGDGRLKSLAIYQSRETPAYNRMLRGWLEALKGVSLFQAEAIAKIDGVSGATMTSQAVLELLRKSGSSFAGLVLGRQTGISEVASSRAAFSWSLVFFYALMLGALLVRRHPSRWVRKVFLLSVVILAGALFNLQYSLDHVISLLLGNAPSPSWSVAFAMIAIVPLGSILFGNVYCGWLCPFGAIQEWLGDLVPARRRWTPPKTLWRFARHMKYVLLFVLLASAAMMSRASVDEADPLTRVFIQFPKGLLSWGLVFLLAISVFFRRFWCRNLCPAGAFLSLLGDMTWLRKWRPVIHPARCDMGVRRVGELDCLQCDRCRMPNAKPVSRGQWLAGLLLMVLALVSAGSIARKAWMPEPISSVAKGRICERSGVGQSRNLDASRIRQLISENQLSDREALYYRPASDDEEEDAP
ncbi:MAG TPA: hypothetical protein DCZ95_18720 [Verrucomicrobia bacterium]|nr:MAG: hypothetical protein A2X46_16965 [Lentisphaerae bacterium GWF2_57_35]HBA86123.1 hypothetical protein [Verrucomicrobiota bacterium]